jgi:hypothetical protein
MDGLGHLSSQKSKHAFVTFDPDDSERPLKKSEAHEAEDLSPQLQGGANGK